MARTLTSAGGASRSGRRSIGILAGLIVVLSACGAQTQSADPESSGSGTPGASGEPSSVTVPGSELVAATGNLGTHDWSPAGSGSDNEKIIMMIYDGMLDLDPETLELVPGLVEEWSLSDDGLTWTFKLRPDVPFHDGWGTVTAEDVEYTWAEWTSPETTHNYGAIYDLAIDGDMENFEVISELEFSVTSAEPVYHLPAALCSCDTTLAVTSKRYHEEMGAEADEHPIGTGPLKFVSSTPGVEVVFEAVPNHWKGVDSGYERIVLREIADPNARLLQVQSGEVDIAPLEASLIGEAEAAGLEVVGIPNIGNVSVTLGGMYYGHPNLDVDAPWIQDDDPASGLAVREALSLAIDRQLIVDRVLHGQGYVAHGSLLQFDDRPATLDPSWELPAYDPEAAREKLAEGGYPDGFPITLMLYPEDIDTIAIGEAIAGMWEEIGIEVERRVVDEVVLDEFFNATSTDGMAWLKPVGFRPEYAPALQAWLSSREDDHHFFSPHVDDAYARLTVEPDREARDAIAREMIEAVRDDLHLIPLLVGNMPFVLGPEIGSWEPIAGGLNTINALWTVRPAD